MDEPELDFVWFFINFRIAFTIIINSKDINIQATSIIIDSKKYVDWWQETYLIINKCNLWIIYYKIDQFIYHLFKAQLVSCIINDSKLPISVAPIYHPRSTCVEHQVKLTSREILGNFIDID
jgi:hypothetical protein